MKLNPEKRRDSLCALCGGGGEMRASGRGRVGSGERKGVMFY